MARHAPPLSGNSMPGERKPGDKSPGDSKPGPGPTAPQVTTYSVHHRYRQLTRILRHLRDQLHRQQPHLAMPTSRMIDQLVSNCPLGALQGDDWSQAVADALQFLQRQLHPLHFDPALFYCADCDAPLFPNEELFDPYDAWLFVNALLESQIPFDH